MCIRDRANTPVLNIIYNVIHGCMANRHAQHCKSGLGTLSVIIIITHSLCLKCKIMYSCDYIYLRMQLRQLHGGCMCALVYLAVWDVTLNKVWPVLIELYNWPDFI